MSGQRWTWWIFGLCAAGLAAAMVWVTGVVLDLEDAEAEARADAEHQTVLRLAMWRMDSWLAPQLAREAARPHVEYRAFLAQRTAYTKILSKIQPDEVLTPSPLLSFRSDLFPLHFEYGAGGELTSPQVPTGNWRDLVESSPELEGNLARSAEVLKTLQLALGDGGVLRDRLGQAEQQHAMNCAAPFELEQQVLPPQQLDYQSRAQTTNFARANDSGTARDAELGPLLPIWVDDGEASPRLLFVRRVRAGGQNVLQGILSDWPRLRDALLTQIGDLLPRDACMLESRTGPTQLEEGSMLATVPALLTAPAPMPRTISWSTSRTVLVAAWLGVLLALVAVGITLRFTVALGERRARFASAVTHELRTPLTTFRMYSEMLADGMVEDPTQRATYLGTLKSEADRLSRLVENVLCFSRLEEGRYRGRRERIAVADLIARVAPLLEQRIADAEMKLEIGEAVEAEVEVDADAVTQILFNLIDNACKYAPEGKKIELGTELRDQHVELSVRDHGAGVEPDHRAEVFRPFERGAREAGDNATPGVGLGLALARGLARDLGGELTLDAEVTPGARFVLRLPGL